MRMTKKLHSRNSFFESIFMGRPKFYDVNIQIHIYLSEELFNCGWIIIDKSNK